MSLMDFVCRHGIMIGTLLMASSIIVAPSSLSVPWALLVVGTMILCFVAVRG